MELYGVSIEDFISFILGLAASAISIYKYADKKGLLPKHFKQEIENIQNDLMKSDTDFTALQKAIAEVLGNITLEEAAAIIAQAEQFQKKGYKEEDALELGKEIIKATAAK